MPRILLVEDEPNMRLGLVDNLEFEGYEVEFAEDGLTGLEKILRNSYNLVLLDVMLPRMSGFDVCKAVRKEGNNTPIILLTAKGEEIDKVLGLELGADDYVTKPFSLRELLARIKAVMRRGEEKGTGYEGGGGAGTGFGGGSNMGGAGTGIGGGSGSRFGGSESAGGGAAGISGGDATGRSGTGHGAGGAGDAMNKGGSTGGSESGAEPVQIGRLSVNFGNYSCFSEGEPVQMSHKEFEILRRLWMKRNNTVSRDELLTEVWGYEDTPTTRTVDNFIVRLRQKVERDPNHPQIILTVHGIGYKLIILNSKF